MSTLWLFGLVAIAALLLGLLGYLTHVVAQRMNTGASRDALLELIDAGKLVVQDLEQRIKPALAAATADGKLSKADLYDLKNVAMEALKNQLSDQAQRILKKNGTDLPQAMSRAIESAVLETKAGTA